MLLRGQEHIDNKIAHPIKSLQPEKHLIIEGFNAKDYSILPIKPTRTFTISVDEGSSMDVDISPDGNKILFTLLGEMFVVPATGGKAVQLTKGMAINTHPAWSPDGKLIAYVSDASGERHTHIRDLSGKYHKVLGRNEMGLWYDYFPPTERQFEPIWLPEGEGIVSGIDIYHLSGFKNRLPNALIKTNYKYPDFPSENHHTIIGFTSDKQYIYFEYYGVIKRYDRKSGITSDILKNEKNNKQNDISLDNNVRVSPDGNWLAYIKKSKNSCTSDSLMIYGITDGNRKSMSSLHTKNSGRIYEQHYSFSSDSKYIYIGFGGKIHRISVQNCQGEIVDFNATVKVDMGPLVRNNFQLSNDSLEVKYTRSANANLDGTKLVFSSLGSIYIQNLPGGRPLKLVDQPGKQYEPVFSPNGKWIAYVSIDDYKSYGHIWCVPVSGGKPQRISSVAGHYRSPSWSPDGKQIVTVMGDASLGEYANGDAGQIQVLSVNGEAVQIIANKVPLYNRPSFSNDGQRIFFTPTQMPSIEKNAKLVYVEIKDTTREQHVLALGGSLSASGLTTYSQQMIISPDERYLVYTYRDDLYLAPLVNLGQSNLIYDTVYGSENVRLPAIRIARGGGDPHWENEGKVLSWSFGNVYYRSNVANIINACLRVDYEGTSKDSRLAFVPTNVIDMPIVADQRVHIRLKESKYYGHGTIALVNARILTMSAAKVIERGTIIIKNGRFIAIGGNHSISVPKGATVLDLDGKTIMPGLIDIHVHQGPESDHFSELYDPWLELFAHGVTTVRDPSGIVTYFGLAELIETGKAVGPRVFSVGHAISGSFDQRNVTSLHSTQILVSNLARLGVIATKQYTLPSRLQKQWLLMASQKYKVNMTNEGGRLPLEYIAMVKDGSPGVEHLPMFGDAYKDVISFLAASETYVTPTLQVDWGKNTEQANEYFRRQYSLPTTKMKAIMNDANYLQLQKKYKKIYSNEDSISTLACSGELENFQLVAAVRKAGGKIAFGSHTEDLGIGAHFELWAMQMGGLTSYEVLEIATIESAKALGLQKDIGSIELGKIADLVILDKNPLENIHNSTSIKYVMKDGVLYDGETLDFIWPNEKKIRKANLNSVTYNNILNKN